MNWTTLLGLGLFLLLAGGYAWTLSLPGAAAATAASGSDDGDVDDAPGDPMAGPWNDYPDPFGELGDGMFRS